MKYYIHIFLLCILVPGIMFAGHGHFVQPVQNVQVIQRQVQFDQNYILGTSGYLAHGQNLIAQKEKETDESLKALLGQLIEELRRRNGTPDDAGNGQKPVVPEAPTPVDDTNPLEREVLAVYNAQCVKCHGDTKQDAGLKLVENGKLVDIGDAGRILVHHRVNGINLDVASGEARMPKGSPSLSDNDVEAIRLYMVEQARKSRNK